MKLNKEGKIPMIKVKLIVVFALFMSNFLYADVGKCIASCYNNIRKPAQDKCMREHNSSTKPGYIKSQELSKCHDNANWEGDRCMDRCKERR